MLNAKDSRVCVLVSKAIFLYFRWEEDRIQNAYGGSEMELLFFQFNTPTADATSQDIPNVVLSGKDSRTLPARVLRYAVVYILALKKN